MSPLTLLAAGIFGFTGVALGAFGAHALKETLAAHQTTALWQTAVEYQLVHAAALLALAGWRQENPARQRVRAAGRCWIAGVLLFPGSLYGLALGGPKALGWVTPLGGLAFLAGWALVIAEACQRQADPAP